MRHSPEDARPTVWAPDARQAGMPAGLLLEVVNGAQAGRRISLPTLPCLLGRGGRCEVVLADPDEPPALSREHATLEGDQGALIVRDHSVNGTRVGDCRLQRGEAAEWTVGDVVQLGPTLRLRRLEEAKTISPVKKASLPVAQPGSLRGFLTRPETLAAAWRRVELNRGAAGPDNITVAEFARDAPRRLADLSRQLMRERYEPLPPRLFAAPKRRGGVRTIAILSVQDRVVQQALHRALQPLLEPHFPPCNFAYRPGVCAHDALRHIDGLLRQGLPWVAETDIAAFFDAIAHSTLMDKLAAAVPDPFALSLLARCLAVGASAPGVGLAQGAATSPLLSNLYLADFDAHMTAGGWNPVRYGDDLLFVGRTRGRAQAALAEAEGFLRARLGLALQPEKTGTAVLAQGFTFLGYRFTEAGRRPSPQSVAALQEKLAEAAPAQAAAVQRGWENYFGPEGPSESAPKPAATPAHLDAERVDTFLRLFGGREDAHARQGKGRFTPCAGPLTAAHVHAHLAGTETLAAYLVRRDETVRTVVLDIDAARGESEVASTAVADFARDLWRTCRAFGVPACLEDSGRRGFHLWIFFAGPVPPEQARKLARLLGLRAGFPRPGVRLEVLPRHTEWPGPELGDAVKLPFGVHPATGRRCHFLDEEGEPVADPAVALDRVRTLPPEQLQAVIAALTKSASSAHTDREARPPQGASGAGEDRLAQLTAGCSVVRALQERALQTGHLRHTHNLILLYTAGRLGAEGAAFVHRTLSPCRNYDARVCQGYLDRLDQKHPPLSCRRIREWLEEEGEAHLCTCAPSRRTPLDCVRNLNDAPAASPDQAVAETKPARRPLPMPPALPSETEDGLREAWTDVAADLFPMPPEEGPPAPNSGATAPDGGAGEEGEPDKAVGA